MSVEEGPGISGMLGMSLWYAAAGLAEPFPAGLCVFVMVTICNPFSLSSFVVIILKGHL